MADIGEFLDPLERLAARMLADAGAPHPSPCDGHEVSQLRAWSAGRDYRDRVAAGVAIGCAFMRQSLEQFEHAQDGDARRALLRAPHLLADMASLAEWRAALLLIDSLGEDPRFEISQLEDLFPRIYEWLSAYDRETSNLAQGRQAGADANRERAQDRKDAIAKMNRDLKRERPDMTKTARARHIRWRVRKDGKGRRYSERRILELID